MCKNINVSNLFGDFKNGQELLDHFTLIFGDDGFFHAWLVYMDSVDAISKYPLGTYPDVESFAYSLNLALEGFPY